MRKIFLSAFAGMALLHAAIAQEPKPAFREGYPGGHSKRDILASTVPVGTVRDAAFHRKTIFRGYSALSVGHFGEYVLQPAALQDADKSRERVRRIPRSRGEARQPAIHRDPIGIFRFVWLWASRP